MVDTFRPHKPQKQVKVKIFRKEAVLLKKLRKYPFGKFTVHKADGIIVRLEINDSQLIQDEENIEGLESL